MPKVVDCKSEKSFINRDETTERYFADVRRFAVLSHDKQRELLMIIKTSNDPEKVKAARDKLINCNQRFVFSIARRWNDGGNIMDLVNEANIALMHAIEKYDISKEENFLTYAIYWMRKAINNYIMNRQVLVRAPSANKINPQVKKATRIFFNENERYPTPDELSHILKEDYGISVMRDDAIVPFDYLSIDETYGLQDDDGKNGAASARVNDVLSKTSANNIDDEHDEEYLNDKLTTVMSVLSDRERYVVMRVYGIMGNEQESYDLIAIELGLCRERIRQIYNEALNKMKDYANKLNQNI